MSDLQAIVDDLHKLIKRERAEWKEDQERMEAKIEQQEVQLEKQGAELGEQKRLLVKEREECKDNIQTITQVWWGYFHYFHLSTDIDISA